MILLAFNICYIFSLPPHNRNKRAPSAQFEFPGIDGNGINIPNLPFLPTTTTTTQSPFSPENIGNTLGEAAFGITNSIINPCRSNGNRIVPVENVGQGFLSGFIGAGIVNTILGNPCG